MSTPKKKSAPLAKRRTAPAPKRTSMFAGIEGVKLGGAYLEACAGRYLFRVEAILPDETRSRQPYLKLSGNIVAVLNDGNNIEPGENGFAGNEVHRVGSELTYGFFHGDYFLREMKAFVKAAFNYDADEITAADAAFVCGMDEDENLLVNPDTNEEGWQPAHNVVIEVEITHRPIADEAKRAAAKEAGKKDYYQNTRWLRSWSEEEVLDLIGEEAFAKLLPNGVNYAQDEEDEEEEEA